VAASRPRGGATTLTEYTVPIVGPESESCSGSGVQPVDARANPKASHEAANPPRSALRKMRSGAARRTDSGSLQRAGAIIRGAAPSVQSDSGAARLLGRPARIVPCIVLRAGLVARMARVARTLARRCSRATVTDGRQGGSGSLRDRRRGQLGRGARRRLLDCRLIEQNGGQEADRNQHPAEQHASLHTLHLSAALFS